MTTNNTTKTLLPILLSFFVMGFVDVVGISVSYIKEDFALNDRLANLIPMMVFLWFAIVPFPTSRLMRACGRKRTVELSLAITVLAMALPIIDYSFTMVMIAFSLLGIGNTVLQVSINPLIADVVPSEKLTGSLTLGIFIKALSSTSGPLIIGFVSGYLDNWKFIFPLYAVITVVSVLWLMSVKIKESSLCQDSCEERPHLLKNRYILMLFSCILLIVGFETGLMTAVPKFLDERYGFSLEQGAFACSLYFIARSVGTFIGSIILSKVNIKRFLVINMIFAVISMSVFIVAGSVPAMYVSLFLLGLTCANVYGIVLGEALKFMPDRANEISALMVTGIVGGALVPPVMGVMADMSSQSVSLTIPLAALLYILFASSRMARPSFS